MYRYNKITPHKYNCSEEAYTIVSNVACTDLDRLFILNLVFICLHADMNGYIFYFASVYELECDCVRRCRPISIDRPR